MVWRRTIRLDEAPPDLGDHSPVFVRFSLLKHLEALLGSGLLEIVGAQEASHAGNLVISSRTVIRTLSILRRGNQGVPRVTIPERARETLDAVWSEKGIRGFCPMIRVAPWHPGVAREEYPTGPYLPLRMRRIPEPERWNEGCRVVQIDETDPCVVLNVIGRTRGDLLIGRRRLRCDAFPVDLALATSDPRFLERSWKNLPAYFPRWEDVYPPAKEKGEEG